MRRTAQINRLLLVLAGTALPHGASRSQEAPAEIGWVAPVSGIVFVDSNRNRSFDRADVPRGGLKVKLFSLGPEEHVIDSTWTDDEGEFDFEVVLEGTYRIEVFGLRRDVTRTDPFRVRKGERAPYFSISTFLGGEEGRFRGRTVNRDSIEADTVSPFSPESSIRLSPSNPENPRNPSE